MTPHEHIWHTMTIGRGFVRWEHCTFLREVCSHPWWIRLADWVRRRPHHWRFHAVEHCNEQRIRKGGP